MAIDNQEINPAQTEAFLFRVLGDTSRTAVILLAALGDRLGLPESKMRALRLVPVAWSAAVRVGVTGSSAALYSVRRPMPARRFEPHRDGA